MKQFLGVDQSLRSRIILFFSALLVAVQVVTFLIVNKTGLDIAERQAQQELVSGNLVFQRLLSNYTEQLTNASSVLAADFGFRRAAATADSATLRSALENHGSRIGADLVLLFTPDGSILADTRSAESITISERIQPLLKIAEEDGRATSYLIVDEKIFMASVLPVLAPDLVAWVVLGFEVDENFVDELRSLTNLDISFIDAADNNSKLLTSSLNEDERIRLLSAFPEKSYLEMSLKQDIGSHGSYFTHTVQLAQVDGSQIFAVLQRPITDTYSDLNRLRNVLVLVAVISIVISVIGIVLIANTITRPLRTLADVAEKIKSGDFSSAANMAERGEIGLLAEGFNAMRDSIATLLHLAYRDSLTDLPNRAMFVDRMDNAIRSARYERKGFSLLFIDLDKFKDINDSYGHDAGDIVLRSVAKKLRDVVRENDTVARLGGDEFAIILMTDDELAVERIVSNIVRFVGDDLIDIGQAKVAVGCSIGVASFPEDGSDHNSLMRHADLAMYADKSKRRGNAA